MNPRSEWRVRKLRLQVAQRDGWRCYRCSQPINPQLRFPHPMSITLEHRTELALGGQPYHPDNCTVAHLHCNTSAGATLGNKLRQPKRTALTW